MMVGEDEPVVNQKLRPCGDRQRSLYCCFGRWHSSCSSQPPQGWWCLHVAPVSRWRG